MPNLASSPSLMDLLGEDMTKGRLWTLIKYGAVAAAGYYGGPVGVEALKAFWKAVGG